VTGVVAALVAGVGFGVFQAVNRRANQLIDAYRGTFRLLLGAVAMLALVALATQDLDPVGDAPWWAFVAFACAGVVHFFFGWTFLGLSQQRIGASRTGVAIAATPLIGSVMAALVLDEPLPALTLAGVLAVVLGVALIATRAGTAGRSRTEVPWFALGSALSWGSSPLFIRWGLSGLPVPLVGVTVGLAAAAALYAVVLRLGWPATGGSAPSSATRWIALGAVLVGVAISSQWIAFDLIEISIAITLMQVSTPVVVFAAPFVVGTEMERITLRLVAGMVAVVGGSVLVVLTGGG
jgi:drug/metabolite transporter (DMT)-like permease